MNPELLIAGGIGLGGLAAKIINHIHTRKKFERLHDTLMESNRRLADYGLGKPSKYITDKLKAVMGVETPIVRVRDKNMAEALGVTNNAFYVQPSFAEPYAKLLNADPSYKQHGLVVMGDEDIFSDTVTLAHELGHSRDYKDDKLPNPFANAGIGLGGFMLSALAGLGAKDINKFITSASGNKLVGSLGTVAAISLPSILATIWAGRRRLGAETRASEHAREALKKLTGKMRTKGAYEALDKDLTEALETYKTGANHEIIDNLSSAALAGGLFGTVQGLA